MLCTRVGFYHALRPSLCRGFGSCAPRLQLPSESELREPAAFRPAAAQLPKMTDIGGRQLFSPEQDMFRESVRKYMLEELVPQQPSFEENGQPTRESWQSMGRQGLLGVNIPAEVGGIGGTFTDEMIVAEEMSYAFLAAPAMALHSTIVMPYIAHYGTKEQQDKYIPAMTAGDCIA